MVATRSGSPFFALAGWTLLASSVLAAIGIVFLLGMFVSFGTGSVAQGQSLGRINDILILVAYALAAPGVVALGAILRPAAAVRSVVLTGIGIAAIAAIVGLQWLLVSGALTFEQQIGPVSGALLILGAWFVATGHLATSIGFMPHGTRMGLIAASYVGYPIWASVLGRRFLGLGAADRSVVPARTPTT